MHSALYRAYVPKTLRQNRWQCNHWNILAVIMIEMRFESYLAPFAALVTSSKLSRISMCLEYAREAVKHWCLYVSIGPFNLTELLQRCCSTRTSHWWYRQISERICCHLQNWCPFYTCIKLFLNLDQITQSSTFPTWRQWSPFQGPRRFLHNLYSEHSLCFTYVTTICSFLKNLYQLQPIGKRWEKVGLTKFFQSLILRRTSPPQRVPIT